MRLHLRSRSRLWIGVAVPRDLFTGLAEQELFDVVSVEVVGFAVEVFLHQLDACVEAVADWSMVVDPLDFVVWHRCPLVSNYRCIVA